MRCSVAVVVLVACGGGSNNSPSDAAGPGSAGFDKPTLVVHANTQNPDGSWADAGPADLSCLGTAGSDTATTVAVQLMTTVKDFQQQTIVPSAMVIAFPGIDYATPFDTETADTNGNVTMNIPVGTTRFGYEMTAASQFPTFLLNQIVDPSTAMQTLAEIQSVSGSTAATLPALIGQTRTPGTGVVAGTFRDCQTRPVSNFVVTVSTTPTTATAIAGSEAYYFSPISMPLPVRHTVADSASGNGIFMVIQLPVSATAYVQAWGYTSSAAIGGDMTLLSQLEAPVLADTVVTGDFVAVRQ
ncbi:MAG TPA: hypothetical protein VGG28_07825 [Kofleriaceae bacterium]